MSVFLILGGSAASALAAPEWKLEQPKPPATEAEGLQAPIGLGAVGDIQFLEPNLGLLTTAGNGKTIPPGVWAYDGTRWYEIADKCGATQGRIAWTGSEDFWTVSDGRPGQAADSNGRLPPLEDNTLCHFGVEHNSAGVPSPLKILGSYAALAFSSSSYQPMDAAACLSPTNCWFGGEPLPAPQTGAFQLHWNGSSLAAEPNARVLSVGSMAVSEGHLYAGIGLPLVPPSGSVETEQALHPRVIYEAAPEGATPAFTGVRPLSAGHAVLPEYACKPHHTPEPLSLPAALDPFSLAPGEGSLWAAAGPRTSPPGGSLPGQLTVLRESGGVWTQVLGPEDPPKGANPEECPEGRESRKVVPANLAEDEVSSIAAEPGTSSAWIALNTQTTSPTATAHVLHVFADGTIVEEELPTKQQREAGIEPKGSASKIACPAQNDCWLATSQGWLFHLTEPGAETLAQSGDQAIHGPLVTFRPPDQGLPVVPSDTVPLDTSGAQERPPVFEVIKEQPQRFASVPVALVSHVHSRILRGNVLELTFQLAVKARVKLVARRRRTVVASTPTRTLARGKRKLTLQLDPRRWPTKLDLQTHALAPLPTVSTRSGSVEVVGTSFGDTVALERRLLGSWR